MLNPIPLGIAQPARELQTAGEFKEIVLTQIRKKFALAIAAFRQGHDLQAFDTLTSLLPEVTTLSGAETVSGRDTSLEAPALSAQIQTYLGLMLWRTQPDRAHEEFERALQTFKVLELRFEELDRPPWSEYGIVLQKLNQPDAVSALVKAVSDTDASPEALAELGLIRFSNKRFEDALGLLDRACAENVNLPEAQRAVAEIHSHAGRRAEAKTAFLRAALLEFNASEGNRQDMANALELVRRAGQQTPEEFIPYAMEGELLYRLNEPLQALAAIKRGESVAAEHNVAVSGALLALKGDCLRIVGDYTGALEALDRALQEDQHNAWALASRGEVYRCLGNYSEAEHFLELAITIRPGNAWALTAQGLTRNALGLYSEAQASFSSAIQVSPASFYSHAGLAETLLQQQRPLEALDALEMALALASQAEHSAGSVTVDWLRGIKATILLALDRTAEAAELIEDLLWRTGQDDAATLDIREVYVTALLKLGRFDDAVNELSRMERAGPLQRDKCRQKRIEILTKLERYSEALSETDQALVEDPAGISILGAKAKILCDIGDFEDAYESLSVLKMADANKEWVSILGRLGWVLQNLGRPDEQLEMYSKAVEFSPDDPWLIKGVANALRMLGRKKEAAVEYERVLTTLKRVDDSVFSLCLGAWCYYGLEQYKEALPRYISAFYFPGDIHGAQFDFGLALLNAGDAESAYCEYSEILNTLSEKTTISVPRKCGILRVAIFDLRQAISEKPDLKKIRETFAIADLMQDTLHKFSLGLSPDFEFVRVRIAQFLRQGTPLAKLSAI